MSKARDIHGAITCTSEVAWNSIKAEQFGSGIRLRNQQKAVAAAGSARLGSARHSGRELITFSLT